MQHKVGILALQGGVVEHAKSLGRIPNIIPVLVKKPEQLSELSGLIIPGGESTTMGKLMAKYGFAEPIQRFHAQKKPLWGTCAGLILLATEIVGQDQKPLGLIDVTVRRNAFGRQLESFVSTEMIPDVSLTPIELVFIRAPIITRVGAGVAVLARVRGLVVAAEQDNVLVSAFHPELTENVCFHQYFVQKIRP